MTTLDTIKTDKANAEARLAALRAQRGAALVDGEEGNDAEIEHLQRLTAALYDAEAAIVTREREAHAGEISATRDRLKAELFKLEEKRLEAIADYQKATRAQHAAKSRILEIAASMRSTCQRGKFPVPLGLSEPAMVVRLGGRESAVNRTIPRHGFRWGPVTSHSSPYNANDDWSESERRVLAAGLKLATEGNTDHE